MTMINNYMMQLMTILLLLKLMHQMKCQIQMEETIFKHQLDIVTVPLMMRKQEKLLQQTMSISVDYLN